MNIRVTDRTGKPVMTSRDLAEIRRELMGQTETTLLKLPEGRWNRAGIMQWEDGPEGFDPLPESVETRLEGRTVTLFPALHDERVAGVRDEVAIRLFTTREKAAAAHEHGVRALFWIATRRECRSLIDTMPGVEKLRLNARAMKPAGEPATLVEQLAELTAHRAWESAGSGSKEPIRSRAAFERALNERWTKIGASGTEVFALAEAMIAAYRPLAAYLDEPGAARPEWAGAFLDIRVQMAYLFASPPPVGSFWTRTPYQWLREYPRYLNAVRRRIEKLALPDSHGGGVARDTRLLNEFTPLWNQLRIRAEQGGPTERSDPNLIQYRWMLEEYRVVLWGGDQRTILPVSAKRLAEQWAKVIGAVETRP
jgi:ATP-dependent helicase HrpA